MDPMSNTDMESRIPRDPERRRIAAERGTLVPTVITLPRRTREGSISDEQVKEVYDTLASGQVKDREAIVVCSDVESEATARNRARALTVLYHERFPDAPAIRAHAVADPEHSGRFISAVSKKPPKKDKPAKDVANTNGGEQAKDKGKVKTAA